MRGGSFDIAGSLLLNFFMFASFLSCLLILGLLKDHLVEVTGLGEQRGPSGAHVRWIMHFIMLALRTELLR